MGEEVITTEIREYNEGMDVEIAKHDGRFVVQAYCEAGFNGTEVDLLDLIKFIKKDMPELLEED